MPWFTLSLPFRISIHALREEGDFGLIFNDPIAAIISIHALREEGDQCGKPFSRFCKPFLSTPSARRATGY